MTKKTRSKTKKSPASRGRKLVGAAWSAEYRSRNFRFDDAQLAVDIVAVQKQITALFGRLSDDFRDKARAVDAHLIDAYNGTVEALKAALTVEKP